MTDTTTTPVDPKAIFFEMVTKYRPEVEEALASVKEEEAKAPGLLERVYDRVKRYFRAGGLSTVAGLLGVGVFLLMPQEIEVAHWKATLVFSALTAGYWASCIMAPYARPHTLVADETPGVWNANDPYGVVFASALMFRAIIVAAVVIGVAVSL